MNLIYNWNAIKQHIIIILTTLRDWRRYIVKILASLVASIVLPSIADTATYCVAHTEDLQLLPSFTFPHPIMQRETLGLTFFEHATNKLEHVPLQSSRRWSYRSRVVSWDSNHHPVLRSKITRHCDTSPATVAARGGSWFHANRDGAANYSVQHKHASKWRVMQVVWCNAFGRVCLLLNSVARVDWFTAFSAWLDCRLTTAVSSGMRLTADDALNCIDAPTLSHPANYSARI